jgi:hypothetical protein
MTTTVSQNISTDNTESTKNTKENRKVVVAEHTMCLVYKIPDNLDLEDETIVKAYWVRYGTLYIEYRSEEYFNQYYQDDDNTDFYIDTDKQKVQKVQCESPYDDINQLKYPDTTTIEDAEGYDVVYGHEDEDTEEEEEEVKEKTEEKVEETEEETEEKVEETEEKTEEKVEETEEETHRHI